jgi:hypothetical protein
VFFDIMFGSLFLKTFRVYKIFGNKSLSKVKISSTDVLKTYGAIMMVDVALLVMWAVTDGMKAVEIENNLDSYWTYTTTECQEAPSWEMCTMFFKILLVVGGVYLAYVTRHVPDKFTEGKWIALSIYQVFILGIVGLLVKSSAPSSLILVQGVSVPAACAVTCCCIFGPKLLMIRNPDQYEDELKTSASTSAGSKTSTSDGRRTSTSTSAGHTSDGRSASAGHTSDGSAGGDDDAGSAEKIKGLMLEVATLQAKLAEAKGQ